MIAEALAGRRIAVTGSTGFLGTAIVERLLRQVPGCELVLLVRPGRRSTAAERVRREVIRNDCFDRLREELGERFDEEVARRVTVVAGDVGTDGLGLDDAGLAAFGACDVVIHSAATVSFDSPLDAAVEVNLLGPVRIAETLQQLGSTAHLVAVSTAYVAGTRRGDAPELPLPETPFATEADWKVEVAAARRAHSDADAESRQPKLLEGFHKRARRELGAAGSPLLADKTEKLRQEWVREKMVDLGRARAQSLGWPDAYAYTKALGERALLASRGEVPVTIVRPSIIESALSEPRPGWIRGFRMAEPVIISYARGLLREFPGIPEGVVDVIPVDLVVAAIVAVAANGPAPDGAASVYQVASGSRNPLKYRRLVDLVQDYFRERPLYDSEGQPIVVPEWSFPGRGRVQRQLERATKAIQAGEKALSALPIRGRRAELGARLEERRADVERALSYVTLYGAYTETEAIFRVDRLLALHASLEGGDGEAFNFDPATIEWDRYVHEIHLPSVVEHARVRTTPGRKQGPTRAERGRKAILSPQRQMAVFDLENTLIAANVVDSYAWLATRRIPKDERIRFTVKMLREAPSLLALDRRDRGDFLRHFYRRYEDAPIEQLRADSWDLFHDHLLLKSFPAGIRRVREHRAAGHRTVLITGALDFVVEPLRPLFDVVISARLDTMDGGSYRGELDTAPPTGEARALLMADFAAGEGFSLEEAVAYADSASDLPMLEAAGHPVAVNPEPKLATIARRRGWHVENWSRAPGAPRPLLPIGEKWRGPTE